MVVPVVEETIIELEYSSHENGKEVHANGSAEESCDSSGVDVDKGLSAQVADRR